MYTPREFQGLKFQTIGPECGTFKAPKILTTPLPNLYCKASLTSWFLFLVIILNRSVVDNILIRERIVHMG